MAIVFPMSLATEFAHLSGKPDKFERPSTGAGVVIMERAVVRQEEYLEHHKQQTITN